jgi:hypothetical protein
MESANDVSARSDQSAAAPVAVAPLPVLSYQAVVETDDFITLGRFRSVEAGELLAKLEAFDIRALITINPAQTNEVELRVPPAELERALEVIALPDRHFFCPACGSAKLVRMAYPPKAQLWRFLACCLFFLPIVSLAMLNQWAGSREAEQCRTIIQMLTVPIGIIALLMFREIAVRIPRRLRCRHCGHFWLPE